MYYVNHDNEYKIIDNSDIEGVSETDTKENIIDKISSSICTLDPKNTDQVDDIMLILLTNFHVEVLGIIVDSFQNA